LLPDFHNAGDVILGSFMKNLIEADLACKRAFLIFIPPELPQFVPATRPVVINPRVYTNAPTNVSW
jgi:hypothetical protein